MSLCRSNYQEMVRLWPTFGTRVLSGLLVVQFFAQRFTKQPFVHVLEIILISKYLILVTIAANVNEHELQIKYFLYDEIGGEEKFAWRGKIFIVFNVERI